MSTTNIGIKPKDMKSYINRWLDILEKYNSIETIFDDPVQRANEERFLKKFDILDEDAEYASFDVEQQLFLDHYLRNSIENLTSAYTGLSAEDTLKINELKQNAETIRLSLTKESKREIIRRLSKFWSIAQVIGVDLIKTIFVDYASEITLKLLTK